MAWIAVDIGGANIKAADGSGFGLSRPFAMWRTPHLLEQELGSILAACPRHDSVAVTMTGELADCFACRTEGVLFILDAVERAVGGRCEVRVLLVDGSLVSLADSRRDPLRAAASNWIGLAAFCGRYAPQGRSLLIDLGSTTCDIIPLRDGLPVPTGSDDLGRLLAGELVYTGVVRSPVCGVVRRVPYRGRPCSVAQELFATTGDVYLTLGDLPEDPEDDQTADHRPSTRIAARSRLGRMIGAEGDAFLEADAIAMARAVQSRQLSMLRRAVRQVQGRFDSPVGTVMVSGQGEFLIERLLAMWPDARCLSLRAQLGESASRCAPAHALAVLACEAR